MLEILSHIQKIADEVDVKQVKDMVNTIMSSKRIFIYGAGRSGLVGKAFGMRLAHLGFRVFIVGETITPAIKKNNVLILISGSGKTASVILAARAAKKQGAKVIGITSKPESKLADLCNSLVVVRGRTKAFGENDYMESQIRGKDMPLSPLGTLFENTCQIFLDGIIVELMDKLGKTEKDMKQAHANIE